MRTEEGRSKPRLEEGEHSGDVGWSQEERGGAAPSYGQWSLQEESLREEPPGEACPGSRTTSGRSPQDPQPRRGECEAEEKRKKGLSTVKVRNDLLVEG